MNSLPKLPSTGCFKEILAHVPSDARAAAGVIGSAVSLARLFTAHVDAVAVVEHLDGRFGSRDLHASAFQTIAAFEDTAGAAAHTLLQFETAAQQAGLSYGKRLIADSTEKVERMLVRASRLYDVSIIAQPDPATSGNVQPQAMFDSGRPVILIPRTHRAGITLDHVGVCWDGGRSAARALHDAMPLLEIAGCIDIIAINEVDAYPESSAEALASHLATRRLNIHLRQPKSGQLSIYRAIMAVATEAGSKLLVMGGYGHSKAGRFVLGAVTRDALKEMSIPTLMSF